MHNRIAILTLAAATFAASALAQSSPLPLPPPVEKELAARASNVTEVTLGKNKLAFAARFTNGKDQDEAATRHLIEGLDGIYVRETRHFFGIERLTADDVWAGRIPEDTIGLSSYPLDLHPVTATDRPAFAPVRHVYGVPLGTLIPRDFDNLILASPAISASHIASGSVRVIPTTIEEGEAAGAAAAQARDHRITFAQLATSMPEVAELRDDLRAHGAIFAVTRSDDIALGR